MVNDGWRIADTMWRALARLLIAMPALVAVWPAFAHDIPSDVHVQAFVKPEGQRLQVLLRVPLGAMNEVDMPLRGPGYLDLRRADAALGVAAELWFADNLRLFEDDRPLPRAMVALARVSLASDRSFASWDAAMAHLRDPPIPPDTDLYWKQQHFDLLLEVPIASNRSRFSIEPRFARMGLRVVTTLRYLPPDGAERAYQFHGNPGLVRLDPRWHQAALRFVADGIFHILDGTDHLLFLVCLVIPFRRFRSLVAVVTAFTVAHSITLIASAYNLAPDALWFPPLIETLIATSIVYMALENIVFAGMGTQSAQNPQNSADKESFAGLAGFALKRRWLVTFGFGLVHGFGFSFALRQTLQFAGSHLLTSLFSFNIGVELGQLLVLLVLIPALEILFRFVVAEQLGTIILSALVGHTAWHWMGDRYAVLRQFRFEMPVIDAAFLAGAMRWAMLAVAPVALYWLVFSVLGAGRQRRTGDVHDAA